MKKVMFVVMNKEELYIFFDKHLANDFQRDVSRDKSTIVVPITTEDYWRQK